MTQPPANPPADPPANGPDDTDNKIRAIVSDVLGSLFSSGKATVKDKQPEPDKAPDIEGQVRKAVTAVNAEQERKSVMDGLRKDVADLKAKMEQPPVRRRRIEQIMGWHGHEDTE